MYLYLWLFIILQALLALNLAYFPKGIPSPMLHLVYCCLDVALCSIQWWWDQSVFLLAVLSYLYVYLYFHLYLYLYFHLYLYLHLMYCCSVHPVVVRSISLPASGAVLECEGRHGGAEDSLNFQIPVFTLQNTKERTP